MTPRPSSASPQRPQDFTWLTLDFTRRDGTKVRPPPPQPAGLREAILRWLEQEL